MPSRLPRLVARGRAVPWTTVITVATQVVREGRARWARLSKSEQDELLRLVRKAPGGPSAFSSHERAQLRRIVQKVASLR